MISYRGCLASNLSAFLVREWGDDGGGMLWSAAMELEKEDKGPL
jgi:hypothetical protein